MIIPGTAQIVVRSLWDDNQGHLLAGVLVEARYKIQDVRKRTSIRSEILEQILKAMKEHEISMASPKIRVEQN